MSPQLTTLTLADDPLAWVTAGFAVSAAIDEVRSIQIGPIRIRLAGNAATDSTPGVIDWSFDTAVDLGPTMDGIPIRQEPDGDSPQGDDTPHPNRVSGFDHIVVNTPNRERSLAALEAMGIEPRRTRQVTIGDRDIEQTFLWMGSTICEMISTPGEVGDGPATVWGLALVSHDIDATVQHLGSTISSARTAVQPGRRIASLRHRELGLSLPVAIMTPHVPK